jgi:hypothetical protein
MNLLVNYGVNASFVPPSKGYYELLHDSGTLTSATTTYTISNLNINKEDNIIFVATLFNSSGVGSTVFLMVNNNLTTTNYWRQDSAPVNQSIFNGRENHPGIGFSDSGSNSLFHTKIKLTENSYFTTQTQQTRNLGSTGIVFNDRSTTSTFTMSSITSLHFRLEANNGVGSGSKIQLYKVRD